MKSVKLTILSNSIFLLFVILFSSHCSAQWVQESNGLGNQLVCAIVSNGNNIFAGSGSYTGVYLSTNNGSSWIQTSLNDKNILSLATNGNYIFAGTDNYYGVFLSSNDGVNWIQTPLNNKVVSSLAVNGDYIFAGTHNFGIFVSSNNGTSWTQTSFGNRNVYTIAVSANYIFAGTDTNGVYFSTDNGTTWTQSSLNNQNVLTLTVNGNYIVAGVGTSIIFISSNNGATWTQSFLTGSHVVSSVAYGKNIFVGTQNYGVFVSNNNGINWVQRNEGFGNNPFIWTLYILNDYIFAGTVPTGVYRRPLSELVAISPISIEVPSHFSLSQNYPNPFNPSTKFKIEISKLSDTRVVVYDVLGREVETLVKQQLQPGTYEVEWDATKYPSGVYFYKLITGDYAESRKMILIK